MSSGSRTRFESTPPPPLPPSLFLVENGVLVFQQRLVVLGSDTGGEVRFSVSKSLPDSAQLVARDSLGCQGNLGILSSMEVPVPAKASVPSNTTTWAGIVQNKSVHPLHFVQPIFADNSKVIQFPSHILEIGSKKYSMCLIGQFMGHAPKLVLFQAMAAKLWGRQGSVSVIPYSEELFLLQFSVESSLARALHGGPWHIGGIPLLLRKWEVGIQPVDFTASLIPVWVQLKQVPFELLTKEGLSYLASAIGKPSHVNQDCSKLLSSDSVSVCVDVDFSKPLREELPISFDGCTRTIGVSYSWKPQYCDLCKKWGHHQMACSTKRSTVQWVPKSTVAVLSNIAPVSTVDSVHTVSTGIVQPSIQTDAPISVSVSIEDKPIDSALVCPSTHCDTAIVSSKPSLSTNANSCSLTTTAAPSVVMGVSSPQQ
ncbi:hypothetical protein Tsubulata_026830 [Turnera subulata]|uniref:DUF4283 domain-containing protein n=1 Tax=Turnera subulata TaxID=218843 RepID=A0A9Q0FPV2_9ROSI|nr:hypothetical protein Tsubulata_026830 [Turnera subulata]